MQLEQNKVTAGADASQVKVQAHKDDLSSIKTQLDNFKSAAAALSDAATWKATQTSTSSDTTKLDATLLGGAGIGGHTIQIDKLASSAQHGFTYTPSATAGTFDLVLRLRPGRTRRPSKVTIAVGANATASDVATAINANENSPVYAAVIKDGATPSASSSPRARPASGSDFTIDSTAMGAGSSMVEDPVVLADRNHAQRVVQGRRRGDGALLGVQHRRERRPGRPPDAQGRHLEPASVTTTAAAIDPAAVTKKVQALVDAYNAVVTETRSDLTEKSDPKVDDELRPGQGHGCSATPAWPRC